jgi:hypothetical protein
MSPAWSQNGDPKSNDVDLYLGQIDEEEHEEEESRGGGLSLLQQQEVSADVEYSDQVEEVSPGDPPEQQVFSEEEQEQDQALSEIIVTRASSARRAAAYEKYRSLEQQQNHRRPWRQRKQRAAKASTFDPYVWNSSGAGDDDSGVVTEDLGKMAEVDEIIDFPSPLRKKKLREEEESDLIQLLSDDTDTSSVAALSGHELPTPSSVHNNNISNKDEEAVGVNEEPSSSPPQSRETAFESDLRRKKQSQNKKPRKFFPDDYGDEGEMGEYPLQVRTHSSSEKKGYPQHALTSTTSAISELTPVFDSDYPSSVTHSQNSQTRSPTRKKDLRAGQAPLEARTSSQNFYESPSERRRLIIERSVRESVMNPSVRDAPASLSQGSVARPDAPDADGQLNIAFSSRLSESSVSTQSRRDNPRPDAPDSCNSKLSGQVNQSEKESGALIVVDQGKNAENRSYTYSSRLKKSEMGGDFIIDHTQPVPSALTELSESSCSRGDEIAVVAQTGVYPGAPVMPKLAREEEKKDEETSLVVRKDDRIVRLERVDSKTIRDPYGDYGVFTGILLRGVPNGQGTMAYADGRTYIGEWKGGRWNGQGKTIFSNGDTYTGQYKIDKRHGIGRYEWADGRIYDGDFVNDQREGKGSYSFPDGSVYTGGFRAGVRHGEGCYRFSDSSVYRGGFQDGKYHGVGECVWADGRCYRGEWKDGRAHGYGIEIRTDGTIRHDGEWRADRPLRDNKKDVSKRKKDGSKKTSSSKPAIASKPAGGPPEEPKKSEAQDRTRPKYGGEPLWAKKIRAKQETTKSFGKDKDRSRSPVKRTLIRD